MTKTLRILIPTDFSPCADKALEFGLHLATGQKAELIICHLNPTPGTRDTIILANQQVASAIEMETEDAFQKLFLRYPSLKKINHRFIQKTGLSVSLISRIAKTEDVSMILMGTRGRGRSRSAFFGSVAAEVVKRSVIPVLVVPENAYIKSIRSILLATDFSKSNHTEAIKTLVSLAAIWQAEIHIVQVISNERPSEVALNPDKVLEWARVMNGIEHHYHFVSSDDVQAGIMRYAYENEVQMLTVLSKSYNLLDQLFHKSLTKQLVYHSRLPLLVLRQ